MMASEAWDGRIISRTPFGRGELSSKEYGGQYLNRSGNPYPGARGYLISIQNA